MMPKPDHLRWTENNAEDAKLAQFIERAGPFFFKNVEVRLADGRTFTGLLEPSSVGNNAGDGPRGWAYYAGITVNGKERYALDYLDVDRITPI